MADLVAAPERALAMVRRAWSWGREEWSWEAIAERTAVAYHAALAEAPHR